MLEFEVVSQLRARGWTLATAESCTGGLIAHRITNVPGSSAVLVGGVVAYANRVKEGLLRVPPDLLAAHGAVSEPVARAMAAGVRDLLGANVAVAVTGIAGPAGGTPQKPVGTTFVAVAGPHGVRVHRFLWNGAREENKEQSAEAALRLVLDYVAGSQWDRPGD